MNIIKKYFVNKENKTPINIVINSEFDYKDHDINILKDCLNCWSKEEHGCYTTLKYEWIYSNPEQKEKIYFVSTCIGELKRLNLTKLIDNENVISTTYMTNIQNKLLFTDSIRNYY